MNAALSRPMYYYVWVIILYIIILAHSKYFNNSFCETDGLSSFSTRVA